MNKTEYRIETEEEVNTYLAKLRYILDLGANISFQIERYVDKKRDIQYTNKYTIAKLFPDEDPQVVLRRELKNLTVKDYLRTVKDIRFPKRSEMREVGKIYNSKDEVYIKIRVELLNNLSCGEHTTFVMSFHFAEKPFTPEMFPYRRSEENL